MLETGAEEDGEGEEEEGENVGGAVAGGEDAVAEGRGFLLVVGVFVVAVVVAAGEILGCCVGMLGGAKGPDDEGGCVGDAGNREY